MQPVCAPFSAETIHRLNQRQVGVDDIVGMSHPFTCPNRGDGAHGDEGGDRGVLVATEGGWICPHCDYTQDWAHASMAQPIRPMLAGLLGLAEDEARSRMVERIDARLRTYKELCSTLVLNGRIFAAAGDAVKSMIESLNVRRLALDGIEVDSHTGIVQPDPRLWTDLKEREPPQPAFYEVLYLDAIVSNPLHPGFGGGGWVERDQWTVLGAANCFAGSLLHGGAPAYWRELPEQVREQLEADARSEAIPTVHLHSQATWHDSAYISANRLGLLALRQAIDEALGAAQTGAADVFTNDGEGFDLRVRCVTGEQIYKLALPYTDEVAREGDPNAIWPWTDES